MNRFDRELVAALAVPVFFIVLILGGVMCASAKGHERAAMECQEVCENVGADTGRLTSFGCACDTGQVFPYY